jgi:hypothetical protein
MCHRFLCQNFSSFTVYGTNHTNVQGERGLHILQFWKYAPYCMLISHPLVVCTCKAFIITPLKTYTTNKERSVILSLL